MFSRPSLLVILFVMALTQSAHRAVGADAVGPDFVPSLTIKEIPYPGFYLYAFYAKGLSNPFNNSDVTINKIKYWSSVKIENCFQANQDCTVELPAQIIAPEQGPVTAYDFVVFVLSPSPTYMWINSDGTSPAYPAYQLPAGVNHNKFAIKILSRRKLQKYLRMNDKNASYQVNFKTDQ